jgi:trimeric autotransporter adhesin
MPSTYTTNGGIELPANGEQSGTWGETVNDNMSIIDRLTNGVGSILLSGTTHTLTTTDGTLSDGQYNVLVLGGSPSGTNTITISPNDGEHVYVVKNASGQTATFTQGSGANVSVLNNTTKIIYADGAGAGAAVVDITGALDLGSLIIAGTSVTATAAELNFVDGVTSNVQTQLNTKAPLASPTFTGTATVSGNLTVDGGTIKLDGNYPVGSNNVALGDGALDASLTGASNTAIGSYSLTNNTSGASNTGLGFAALGDTTTGNYNTGIGTSALENNTTASNNTAVGYQSLFDNTTGAQNVALGMFALANNTTADYNTAVGYAAMEANTGGSNTAVGGSAMYSNTTGNSNTSVGTESLENNTTGSFNTAVGKEALESNTTASYNTAVGYNALTSNTTGPALTAIGAYALANNTTGSSNTATGWYALISNTTGSDNTAVGRSALQSNTTGYSNVAIGGAGVFHAAALQGNTEGYGNIAIGAALTGNTTGTQNVAIGRTAMYSSTTGSSNVAIGQAALGGNTTGGNNTAVGYQAGDTITTGINNTIIGYDCDAASTSANAIALGHGVTSSSDYFYFGKAGNVVYNNFTANASWTRSSDERWKKDINTNTDLGLDFINAIRTVTYKWKAPSELDSTLSGYNADVTSAGYEDKMYGFIAQEVKQALDDSGITNFSGWNIDGTSPDDKQGVSYEMFVVPLINAIQEQQATITALTARITALENL